VGIEVNWLIGSKPVAELKRTAASGIIDIDGR
jgi:hypothetical protein